MYFLVNKSTTKSLAPLTTALLRNLRQPISIVGWFILWRTNWADKDMHWKTYYRFLAKHTHYSNDAYAGMLTILKRMDARFDEIKQQM